MSFWQQSTKQNNSIIQSSNILVSKKEHVRDGPFNFQGGGGYGFFQKKYSDSQCCWKNIL